MFVEPRLQRAAYGYVLVWPTQHFENFTVVVYKENDILCKHPILDFEVLRSLDTELHSCIVNGSHFERNMWASVGKDSNGLLYLD